MVEINKFVVFFQVLLYCLQNWHWKLVYLRVS